VFASTKIIKCTSPMRSGCLGELEESFQLLSLCCWYPTMSCDSMLLLLCCACKCCAYSEMELGQE
jgi:hypothetical protein